MFSCQFGILTSIIMELLTPGSGLLFWQILIFATLVVLLRTFAWKPILNSLRIREDSIQEALDSAKAAKEEMAQLKSANEELLNEAKTERDNILKAANTAGSRIKEDAKDEASKITDKMVSDARKAIVSEKNVALAAVRRQVVSLSVEIAEKLLKTELEKSGVQEKLVSKYLEEKNLN